MRRDAQDVPSLKYLPVYDRFGRWNTRDLEPAVLSIKKALKLGI